MYDDGQVFRTSILLATDNTWYTVTASTNSMTIVSTITVS